MLRLLSWLLGLVVTVIAVAFAVSNRAPVTLGLWPFAEGVNAPVYAVALAPLALGLVIGAALAGVGTLRARLRARSHAGRARSLEREIERLRTGPKQIPAPTSSAPRETAPQP